MSETAQTQRFERRFRANVAYDTEDSGMALVCNDFEEVGAEDENTGLSVRLTSWDEEKKHGEAELLRGRDVEIIVRDHIEMPSTQSGRGFTQMEPFKCRYGSEVRVYESSAASHPCIWLNVQGDAAAMDLKPGEGTAHLTIEQAQLLRDQLDWLIQNHYQLS